LPGSGEFEMPWLQLYKRSKNGRNGRGAGYKGRARRLILHDFF
jgi:hypothetical protein